MTLLRLRLTAVFFIAICASGLALPKFVWGQGVTPDRGGPSGPRMELHAPDMPLVAGQSGNVQADPIRCWWRTTAGAVRTGETFSLVLTCAVIENEQVQVIPDESRLGPTVIQLAPFETVGGYHPPDEHSQNRRFFQYEYTLRMINPDFIGKDVKIPDQTLHYRVNSKLQGNTEVQGRDLMYGLAPLTIRVLALVPADALDIRDTPDERFAGLETMNFRASMLRIVAITLLVLGVLVAVLAILRVFTRAKKSTSTAVEGLSTGAVLGLATSELKAVQEESQGGWQPPLVDRALAAGRVVASCALDEPPSQRIASGRMERGDGRLTRPFGKGKTAVVWSAVTADYIARRLAAANGRSAERRQMLEQLQTALATWTEAQYTRANGSATGGSFDSVLTSVADAAQTLKGEHAWPRPLVRRLMGRMPEPESRT